MAKTLAPGDATIAARANDQPLKLYCSWFCPYAQRAWIAAEEKGLDYQYIEINPYEQASEEGKYTKIALSVSCPPTLNAMVLPLSTILPATDWRKA
jgi:glutaredoxin